MYWTGKSLTVGATKQLGIYHVPGNKVRPSKINHSQSCLGLCAVLEANCYLVFIIILERPWCTCSFNFSDLQLMFKQLQFSAK